MEQITDLTGQIVSSMGKNSEIQWTDHTWNIARGCTKISEGCKYCYMMRDGEKFGYDGTKVEKTKTVFRMPLKIKEPRSKVWWGKPLVFTSSLTDVFHPDIDPFRQEMWDIIEQCKHLTFQVLTKRPERFFDHCRPLNGWGWGLNNVWMGISAENQENLDRRLKTFLKIPADVKFLSLEPLLGPVDLTAFFEPHLIEVHEKITTSSGPDKGSINYISSRGENYALKKRLWVIVGGESGNDNGNYRYRPAQIEWFESIVEQCKKAGVPVFVKQLGTHLAKELGLSDRHGGRFDELPEHLRIREFPSCPEAWAKGYISPDPLIFNT